MGLGLLFELYNVMFQAIFAISLLLLVMRFIVRDKISKREKSSQYITKWNSLEYINAEANFLKDDKLENINANEIKDYLNINSYQLLGILNFFEEMAINVDNRLVDELMLIKYFRNSFLSVYRKSEKFIYILREIRNNNSLYCNLEKMYGKWVFKYMLSEKKRYK